ncbi:hypothetical protein BD410DRAFT_516063 [Rickenella mellea]|uniref:Uncharacterized protein n=1 Tax=Rickenella mellea TaxID=50990 RepID=A0A4Y7PSD0_9AGAM|nr:hypothetical protein BD410DRAFT_516063 [Rickenella mellea]
MPPMRRNIPVDQSGVLRPLFQPFPFESDFRPMAPRPVPDPHAPPASLPPPGQAHISLRPRRSFREGDHHNGNANGNGAGMGRMGLGGALLALNRQNQLEADVAARRDTAARTGGGGGGGGGMWNRLFGFMGRSWFDTNNHSDGEPMDDEDADILDALALSAHEYATRNNNNANDNPDHPFRPPPRHRHRQFFEDDPGPQDAWDPMRRYRGPGGGGFGRGVVGFGGLGGWRGAFERHKPDYVKTYTHPQKAQPGFTFDFALPSPVIVVDAEPGPSGSTSFSFASASSSSAASASASASTSAAASSSTATAPPTDPQTNTTLVCAKCLDPLLINVVGPEEKVAKKRIWALRCGHLVDGRCVEGIMRPPPPPVVVALLDEDEREDGEGG